MSFEEKLGKGVITTFVAAVILALSPLLVAPLAIVDGWAFSKLWHWFAEPFLHAPPLSLWPAVGIFLTVRLLTSRYTKDERKPFETFIGMLTTPLLMLFYGYLVHLVAR